MALGALCCDEALASAPHSEELSRHENRGLDAKHRWPCVVKLVDELERMGHYSAIREKPERIGA
jgi:hypothetical protein